MRRMLPLVVIATSLLTTLSMSAASAQTGYPPPSTTSTTAPPTEATINIGVVISGGHLSAEACGFTTGTVVRLVLNGVFLGQGTTDSRGCLGVGIDVVGGGGIAGALRQAPLLAAVGVRSIRLAADSAPEVIINGIRAKAHDFGEQNTLVVSGTGENGAARTVNILFTITKPTDKVLGSSETNTNGATTNNGSQSGFARTGLEVLRLTFVGIALIALGWFLVQRRRRSPTAG